MPHSAIGRKTEGRSDGPAIGAVFSCVGSMAGFFSFVPIGFVVFVTFNRVLMQLAERYGIEKRREVLVR